MAPDYPAPSVAACHERDESPRAQRLDLLTERGKSLRVLREVVESSSLRSIGYDRKTQTLEVEFTSGGIYRYDDVPAQVWAELRQSLSKGKFFQERIRDHFPTARV